MHRLFLHNDEMRDAAFPSLAAGQVGLLSGWGVFTTIRIYDGQMFCWDRHWSRMKRDAQRMSVPFPQHPDRLEEQLYKLIESNEALNATLRVVVVRNRGGLWEGPGQSRDFDVIAFTSPVNAWPEWVKLDLVPNGRFAASEFAGTKYISWSENLARYERAHLKGLDDALLLNERGEVAECTSANILVAHGHRVSTPPLSSGCLGGVTRAVLLEEIQVSGLEISERVLLPADLASADEVFITSSTRELLPVSHIAGINIRAQRDVCDWLQSAFSSWIKQYFAHRKQPVVKGSKF